MPLNVIFSVILAASAVFMAVTALYLAARRNAPGALPLTALLTALAVYTAAYGCELLHSTAAEISLCLRIEYLGIPFLPPLFILTVRQMAANKVLRFTPAASGLFIISFLTVFFHYTNSHHGLYYSSLHVDMSGPFPVASLGFGPWYWVQVIYLNVAQIYCNILFLHMFRKAARYEKRRVAILFAASFVPWTGLIIYLAGHSPWGLDINAFTLSFTGLVLAWGVYTRKIVDILPMAHDALFKRLHDGVLVLDGENRITYMNPAALTFLGTGEPPIGAGAAEVLAFLDEEGRGVIEDGVIEARGPHEKPRWFDLRSSPLKDRRGNLIGRLLTLRDVTETRRMEMAIRSNEKKLREEIAKVRNIQAAMMPNFSRVKGYDIAGTYLPVDDLSGDFFDGFFIDNRVYQVIICDVMNHGMAPAYVGMEIRSLFRAFSGPGVSPSRVIEAVNRKLTEDFSEIIYFATVAVCQIDSEGGTITYSSGGHPPSLYFSADEKKARDTGFTGALIGLRAANEYHDIRINMMPGDLLVMYTDGVTESRRCGSGEMLGSGGLEEIIIGAGESTALELIHSILDRIFIFTDYAPLGDDITMICLRKL